MSRTRNLVFVISVSILFIIHVFALAAPMQISGIAIQEKHGIPILYASIYTLANDTILLNNATIFDPDTPFRMESRFIVGKYSKRQNHQLWMELALINSPKPRLKQASKELAIFSKLMKFEMRKGDQLVFDYSPSAGTKIILDGILIKTIKGPNLQPILRSIWFGKRSPSKAFTLRLSQQPKSKDLKAFNQIEYSSTRQQAIHSFFIASLPSVNKKETITKIKSKPKFKMKKPTVKIHRPKTIAKRSTGTVENIKNKITQKDTTKKTPTKVNRESQKQRKLTTREQQPSELDKIMDTLKQEYKEELKEYIELKARPTPPRKVRKVPKYKARLLVRVSGKNNRLTFDAIKIVSGEFNNDLRQSIINSVKQLRKIPPMPESISDTTIEIQVVIGFNNCKRSTSAWLCL